MNFALFLFLSVVYVNSALLLCIALVWACLPSSEFPHPLQCFAVLHI